MIQLAAIVALASLGATGMSPEGSVSDDSVLAVASRSLPSFLASIPVAQEARYGFAHRDEFARAVPGTPLPMLEDPGTTGDDSLWRPQARGLWRVPVLVDGRARAFLTVEATPSGLDAVDFGGADLAREIGELEPARRGPREALLRLDRLGCDILIVDRHGRGFAEGEFIPLRSARSRFASDSTVFRSRKALGREVRRLQSESGRGRGER